VIRMIGNKVSSVLAAGFAVAFSLSTSPVAANGRFPAAGQIVVNPMDANHVLIRTTYGILTTRDAGKNWDWICEQAVKWTGQYDPSMAITADGSVLAGIYDHLGVSHGDSCSWSNAGGLDQKNVIDVSTERKTPAASVALTSSALGGDMFVTQLWASSDNASTWSQAGVDLSGDFQALTVDVAPANPMRVYMSGLYGGGASGAIERSLDRGGTWQRLDVPGSDKDHAPFIAAIDPTNEQTLYVRLSGSPGRLLVSTDGGGTWSEVFKGSGILKGFALSPDGKTIVVGGEADGVWRAPASTLKFEKVSSVGVQCLAWSSAGIHACASEFKDGFSVGLSSDEGASFIPLMHLSCVRGPLSCGAETEVGKLCPAAWPATADLIDQASCAPDAGGESSSSSSGSGGSGMPDAGTGGGGGSGDTGGCGCHAASPSRSGWETLLLGLGLIGAVRRTRGPRRRKGRGAAVWCCGLSADDFRKERRSADGRKN
jgi:MYXO-CTERM domain-containing protein